MANDMLGRRDRELANIRADNERLRRRLIALSAIGQRIGSSLEVDTVFQAVVDGACELTGARYGALGVFGRSRNIELFVTHGITSEQREGIGRLPEGLGILGWLQDLQEPLRLGDLTKHPRSVGFPSNHPSMKTFLGAPVRHAGETLGNLYLTEKAADEDFTPEDESLLVLFAAQAAMAIRNAQLHRQVQDLVVLAERDRIGMDLHDGVIQSLYATGLRLEACLEDITGDDSPIAAEVAKAIDQLNQVIGDIRGYIFGLRPAVLVDADLGGAIGRLLEELKVNALLNVELTEAHAACEGLSEDQRATLFFVAQEAVTNARRHAAASSVSARLEREDDEFVMTIADNGRGFDVATVNSGYGLHNMRERVEKLGGSIKLVSQPEAGAQVIVRVPLNKDASHD